MSGDVLGVRRLKMERLLECCTSAGVGLGFFSFMILALGLGGWLNRISAVVMLIVAAAIGHVGNARLLTFAGWSFVAGILIFSGSLYALALTSTTILGAITPIGGLAFLIGWACLAFFAAAS